MAKRKVFKKDLTPIGRGGVKTNAGKGSRMQRTRPGQREEVTGGDPFSRAGEIYPKAPPPVPAGIGPRATAMMPGIGMGIPDEE